MESSSNLRYKSNTIDTRNFTEIGIHRMCYTSSVNPTLRSGAPWSLPTKVLHKHTLAFHYLDFLPLRRWKPTLSNFPQQPTWLVARRASPSRLGAKAPTVTNMKHTISAKLKCSRFVVLLVLSSIHSLKPNSKILQESHNLIKRCWGELNEATKLS
jgi:hypothetical protein